MQVCICLINTCGAIIFPTYSTDKNYPPLKLHQKQTWADHTFWSEPIQTSSPYISYIGMCRLIGSGFWASGSISKVSYSRFWVCLCLPWCLHVKWGLVLVGTVTATTIQSEGSIDGEERGLTTLCTVPLAYTLAAQANFIRSDVG